MKNTQETNLQRKVISLENQLSEVYVDQEIAKESLVKQREYLEEAMADQEVAHKQVKALNEKVYEISEGFSELNKSLAQQSKENQEYLAYVRDKLKSYDDESSSEEVEDIKANQDLVDKEAEKQPLIDEKVEIVIYKSKRQDIGAQTLSSTDEQDCSKACAAAGASGITGLFCAIIAKGSSICDNSNVSPSSLLSKFDGTKVYIGIAASFVAGLATYMLKSSNAAQEPKL